MAVRETTPPKLIHRLDLWDNSYIRCGPNERDALDLAKRFSFDTDENGMGPATLVLPRPDRWDVMDSAMLANLTTFDQEGRVPYQGRVNGRPHTGVNEIEVETVGWSKHGDDDETAAMIFRDADQNAWQGPDVGTRINFLNQGFTQIEDPQQGLWGGVPSLALTNTWSTGSGTEKPVGAAVYGGNKGNVSLGSVYVQGTVTGYTPPSTSIDLHVLLLDDTGGGSLNIASGDLSSDLEAAASFAATLNATGQNRKWALLEFYWSGVASASGNEATYQWNMRVFVYGLHGLTKQGVEPDAGFLVSQMVQYAVNRWCPKWITDGDSIELTSFIVPHAVFVDPNTTVNTMLQALALFGGDANYPLDWFVYTTGGARPQPKFYLKSPGNFGHTWRLRRQSAAEPLDQGPDIERIVRGVMCFYDPGDGSKRSVGFPGSGALLETSQLLSTDLTNPAVRGNLPIYKSMDMGVVSQPGATLLGQMFLAERNRQEWRGSVKAKGMVRGEGGGLEPCYMVKALEQTVLEDDEDHTNRRIIGTSYDDQTRTNEITIGNRPDRLETMLAEAGVVVSDLSAS